MSEAIKQNADTSCAAEGVEAGLNSTEDTKDWKAGNELDLKAEGETQEPLFMRDSPEGDKGNAQDEKDQTEE